MEITPAMLALAAPLALVAGVALQLLIGGLLTARAKGVLATCCALPALAAVLALFPAVLAGGPIDLRLGAWDGPLILAVHVDVLSLLFALMGTGLGSIVLLYSIGYMAEDRSARRFYAFMLTFIAGMVGLVFSSNLFFLYLCWEAMGLCSFGLVGFWYRNPEAVSGARKVLLMTHLAGYGLLAAVLVLYARSGSALWTDPAVAQAFGTGTFVLMLIALTAKSVQFPLHTWIPEAMAAPTPVSALLHAACYVKAGVYLAARMHSFGAWHSGWSAAMITIGTVTMLGGVAFAMMQSDLKRMLAFHTVSQIGYMITGIGIGTPLAITAGLLHCLTHGFFKGGLFLAAGSVQHATGTRDMNELGGLAERMPRTAAVWLISAGCIMGVPLLSGFTGKWMLYGASLEAGYILPALAAWLASVGTVFSFAKATSTVFLGSATAKSAGAHEAAPTMQWAMSIIAAGSIVLSIAPQLPVNYILNPILAGFGLQHGVEVSWFGLTGTAGTWWITGGAVLALVSLAAGWLVYLLRVPPAVVTVGAVGLAGAGGGVFTGGEPLGGDGRLPASDFSKILKSQWAPLLHALEVDRLYLAVWDLLRGLSNVLARLVASVERRAAIWTGVITIAVFAGLAWLAPLPAPASGEAPAALPRVLGVAVAIALVALLAATVSSNVRIAPLMLLSGAAAVAGLVVADPTMRLTLMESAALLSALLVWWYVRSSSARWTYLTVVVLSACGLVAGEQLLHTGGAGWAPALLATALLLKLAAIPLSFWLLAIADELPATVLGLVIAVIDIAAFGELAALSRSGGLVFEPRPLWVAVAAATALMAALLLLTAKSLKRLLALSTIEDMGFLLLAAVSGSHWGWSGAIAGAAVHSLAKGLLFVSLSAPERDGALTDDAVGLAGDYPLSAGGFLAGMLAMLGVPPTLGFVARWRLYEIANEQGPWILGLFLASSALSLIAYALALTRVWWGPGPERPSAREPVVLRLVIVALVVLLLVAGLWPSLLNLIGEIQ